MEKTTREKKYELLLKKIFEQEKIIQEHSENAIKFEIGYDEFKEDFLKRQDAQIKHNNAWSELLVFAGVKNEN